MLATRVGYLICETHSKMKVWVPLFKGRKRSVIVCTKIKIFFLFSVVSLLSWCFYLPFNIILNKVKNFNY